MPVTTPTTPKTTSSTGPPSIKQQHRQAKSLKRCGAAGCTDVVVSNTMTCARHADPVEKPVVAPKAEFTHDDLLRAMINVEDVLGADDKNVQVLNDFIMRVVAADKKAEKRLKKKQDKIKKLKKRLAKVNQQTARVYLAARDN